MFASGNVRRKEGGGAVGESAGEAALECEWGQQQQKVLLQVRWQERGHWRRASSAGGGGGGGGGALFAIRNTQECAN